MQSTFSARAITVAPLFLVVILFPFFFVGGPSLESSQLYTSIWDCGHLVFFGLLTTLIDRKYPLRTLRSALILTITVFLIGGTIELIQTKTGRDGNWSDIFHNLSGTWIALVWLQPVSRLRRWARFAVLSLAVPALANVALAAALHIHSGQQFPLIADFESVLEMLEYRSKLVRTEQYKSHGRYGAQLTLTTDTYSGIGFTRSYADWSSYKQLSVDLYNPDTEPLKITVRINDIEHDLRGWKYVDRFNQSFQLSKGWNHLSIPLETIQNAPADRLMDLSRIASLGMFTTKLPAARTLYIDNLRLE